MALDILVIPDPQVKEDVPTDHLAAAGRYAVWSRPDVIVFIGDVCDTPSLSRYNTAKETHNLTLKGDIGAAIAGLMRFLAPIRKARGYNPRLVICSGNHEPSVRIKRLIEDHPELDGSIIDKFEAFLGNQGFEIIPFLEVIDIEGIRFSHYHQNPSSVKGAPVGGMIETAIKNVGYSFVGGHTQGLKMGKRYLSDGTVHIGVVCGSFYMHKEGFMGVQGNNHWHGVVSLNNASNGDADISEVSLRTLLELY